MKRNNENLQKYRQTCDKVIQRADNRCEVLVDEYGNACSELPKKRCGRYITDEMMTYTNFLHRETRNGKSDEWILDSNNIILGCASHHFEEGRTGKRVESVEYGDEGELYYLPEE